eukprot:4745282-Lingulodinium_polyedra.AAC.1
MFRAWSGLCECVPRASAGHSDRVCQVCVFERVPRASKLFVSGIVWGMFKVRKTGPQCVPEHPGVS